jgi:hypothetical protein
MIDCAVALRVADRPRAAGQEFPKKQTLARSLHDNLLVPIRTNVRPVFISGINYILVVRAKFQHVKGLRKTLTDWEMNKLPG